MRLDASYDLCSKLGSKLIFDEIMAILVLQDHFPILTAFLRGIFFRVRPDKNIFAMIYSHFKKKTFCLRAGRRWRPCGISGLVYRGCT
jgi:hypothetical protein